MSLTQIVYSWKRPRVTDQIIANLRFSMILLAFFGLATMLDNYCGPKPNQAFFTIQGLTMTNSDPILLNRRKILAAALAGGGVAALSACTSGGDAEGVSATDLWAGYDERITERTLAEAEKLFGLQFSEAERRQILGGVVEEDEDGFFAQQIKSLGDRRNQDIPITLQPATSFDPRLPGPSRAPDTQVRAIGFRRR